jgi:hypothetical protein
VWRHEVRYGSVRLFASEKNIFILK